MKITTQNKAILWSVLEKYDGVKEYTKFCDAISNLIQGKNVSGDFLIVYNFIMKIDTVDQKKIDTTIGADIDACLFSI